MVRRGSTSSHGSPAGSFRQPFSSGLQRQNSSGSMSSRNLRSPSPSRRVAPSPSNDIPPVPKAPIIPPKSVKRSASLDPPRRVMSPTDPPSRISRPGGGDASTAVPPAKKKAAPPSKLERVPEKDVAPMNSPSSPRQNINFSRPMSPPLAPRSPQSNTPGGGRTGPRPRPASSLGFHHDNVASLPVQTQINIARAQQKAAPALVAATSAARPTPTSMSQGPLRKPSSRAQPTRPLSMAVPPQIAEDDDRKPDSGVDMNTRKVVRPIYPPVKAKPTAEERAAAALAVPSPSDEQIKKFQTRAASMLARPLHDEGHTDVSDTSGTPASPKQTDDTHLKATRAASNESTPKRSATTGTNRFSVSPARSAHFSDTPLLEVTKHNPPARSISPVKSAMKGHSPGPSPDASRVRDASVGSEARSQMSDDSNATGGRKKKGVKVSFEANPVLVGEAAPSVTSPTDTVLSPQYRKGLSSDEEDTGMGTRPTLPSFGSVRSRKTIPDDPLSPGEAHIQRELDDDAPVSHAVSDLEAPSIAVQPATPRAGEDDEDLQLSPPPRITDQIKDPEEPRPTTDTSGRTTEVQTTHVSPHTLAIVAGIQDDTKRGEESDEASEVFSDAAEEQDEQEIVGDTVGYASLDAIIESPAATATNRVLSAEQPTSIVPSGAPQLDPVPPTAETPPPEGEDWNMVTAYWKSLSEQKKREIENEAQTQQDEPLNGALATANTKAPETSRNLEHQLANGKAPLPPWPDKQYQASVKPPKSALKKTTPVGQSDNQVTDTPAIRKSTRNSATKPGGAGSDSSAMRKSMRDSTTMSDPPRNESSPQLAPRPREPRGKPKPKTQPVPGASPAAVALAKGVAAANPQAFTSAPKTSTKKPGLGRTLSNDSSASDSSFQRNRRNRSKPDGGRYTMARSMRGGPDPQEIRAKSPPAVAQEAPRKTTMRSSVRGSTDTARLSMRSPEPSKQNKSSGILGFGKSKQKAPKKAASKPASRFSSRFSDSSDDDGDAPTFRSRFDDSDDSDDDDDAPPSKLAPVRGIPRKAGRTSGESTDLSDEEQETEQATKPRPSTPPAQIALDQPTDTTPITNGTAVGNALSAGTLRKDASKESTADRSSRFSVFGHSKKRSEQITPEAVPAPEKASMSPPESPALPKTMRPSRKDYQSPSRATRMFRRLSSSRNTSPNREGGKEDFPFPPPPIPDEYKDSAAEVSADRPNTSDGVAKSKVAAARPGLGDKRDSAMTAPESMTSSGRPKREPVVSERTGKKKKFQGLRRAFGLHD